MSKHHALLPTIHSLEVQTVLASQVCDADHWDAGVMHLNTMPDKICFLGDLFGQAYLTLTTPVNLAPSSRMKQDSRVVTAASSASPHYTFAKRICR